MTDLATGKWQDAGNPIFRELQAKIVEYNIRDIWMEAKGKLVV